MQHLKTSRLNISVVVSAVILFCSVCWAGQTIAHWSFNEGTGTGAGDRSGNGHDAILMNHTHWDSGISGTCLAFDGVDDYAIVADDDRLTAMRQLTVEAWVYLDVDVTHNHTTIIDKWYGSNASWALVLGLGNQPRMGATEAGASGGVETVISSNQAVPLHQWTHVVAVYDGVTMNFYLNGVKSTTWTTGDRGDNYVLNNNTLPVYIGGGTQGYFKGKIDEVSLYNYPLSQDTILAHYQAFSQSPCAKHIIAQWSFDEGIGTAAGDQSDNGHNALLMNHTHWASGISGTCLAFDGIDDYAMVADDDRLTGMTQLSIEAWVYLDADVTHNHTTVIDKWFMYNASWALVLGLGNQPRMGATEAGASGGVETVISSNQAVPLHQWTHVVAVYDGVTMNFYLNGVKSTTWTTGDRGDNYQLNNNTLPVYIGGGTQGYLKGKIDETTLYDCPLDSATIAAHYQKFLSVKTAKVPTIPCMSSRAFALSGTRFIFSNEKMRSGRVVLYGAGGKMLLVRNFSGSDSRIEVCPQGLAAGLYFYRMTMGDQTITQRFVYNPR
jgi:signal peptidase I